MFIDKIKKIDHITDDVAFLIYNSRELYNRKKVDKYIPPQVTLFFDYLKQCWVDNEKQIEEIKDKAKLTTDPVHLDAYLRQLEVIKEILFVSNYFLKDILDISIKETPSPFLIILNDIVQKYNSSYGVIAIKCPIFNYQFIPLYDILESSKLSDISVIAYPFTESHTIFNNTVLAHEIGHFIYRKLDFHKLISDELGTIFDDFEREISDIAKNRSLRDPLFAEMIESQIWRYIWSWCEELASDFFAIKNVGLAYFLSFLKVHYLTPLSTRMNSFSDSHPSSNYRIRRMVGLLIDTGWESILKDKCNDIYEWINYNNFLTILKNDIEVSENYYDEDILSEAYVFFDKMRLSVVKVVNDITQGNVYKPDQLTLSYNEIIKYLQELAPPLQSPMKKGKNYDPISIINASFILLFNGIIEILLSNSDRLNKVEDKYFFYKKLNELALKGIEDYLIVEEWG